MDSKKTPAKKEGRTMRANIVKADSKVRAMVDSGANVNVTSKEVANKYGIEVKQTRVQDSVQFGKKGSKSEIKGYGRFGDMIRQAAIVDDISETIIHVGTFTDRGREVTFDDKNVYIRDKESGEIICQGERERESGLYYIDMDILMKKEVKVNGPTTKQTEIGEKRNREQKKKQKGERITREQQRWVILLHQRMNHISSTTMSEAVRAGTWEGIPPGITAAVIEKVMKSVV